MKLPLVEVLPVVLPDCCHICGWYKTAERMCTHPRIALEGYEVPDTLEKFQELYENVTVDEMPDCGLYPGFQLCLYFIDDDNANVDAVLAEIMNEAKKESEE